MHLNLHTSLRNLLSVILLTLLTALTSWGQKEIEWSVKVIDESTATPALQISAKVPSGAHFYALDNPQADGSGANPLSIVVTPIEGCEVVGAPTASKTPVTEYDATFGMNQRFYTSGTVVFTQRLKATAPEFKAKLKVRGQYCTDTSCFPARYSKEISGTAVLAKAAAAQPEAKDGKEADKLATTATPETTSSPDGEAADESLEATDLDAATDSIAAAEGVLREGADSDLWTNVEQQIAQLRAGGNTDAASTTDSSLWAIFIAGFLAGFIALVTPCVWPMIPMTVSFFLKQNKTRAKSIRMASLYGLSIVLIYMIIGIAVTVMFGATALNNLATSAVFNIIFFLLLVVFAISFLGGFEITLPASWTNKMDSKVDSTTGLLSIFFMAFTLALVSFSCTGPIVGTLLVEAASSGSLLSPAIGMLGFALALALPFTIFAMFPTMLKSMPKSGGWLNSVKVVLGFLELALALKFLSVADLAYHWGILDREVFVALWIVIFALLGVYLLGKLRFPHDSKVEKTSVTRFMLAVVSFAFAIYMVPGLWGAPLKAISAFAPPMYTQDFSLYEGEVKPATNDYDVAMQMAAREQKPVLVDFSGYGCVNCRKMEGAVWTDTEVKDMLDNQFVVVSLYVDDKTALPSPITKKNRKGEDEELETYGDLWSFLQLNKFGMTAQPYHVILDPQGNLLEVPQEFTEDPQAYLAKLRSALTRYQNAQAQQQQQ